MSNVATISKLEAANRQLCTAIRLFFADADAVAVHTLACAAREIYEKHCHKAGRGRMFDFVRQGNSAYDEKALWKLLNDRRNFFKHAGDSLEERIEFDDSMNDFQILAACTDCATLCSSNQPAEVQAYLIWFLAAEFPELESSSVNDAEANLARTLQAQVDQRFPGLRTASRAEKKRFGTRLLDDVVSGRLVERISAPNPLDVKLATDVYLAAK